MNAIEKIKAAQQAATHILEGFVSKHDQAPDAVEARKTELMSMTKAELSDLVLSLEKPKTETAVKVEDIAKAILESPDCAVLTYEQIAGLITGSFPDRNTSGKSIGSYASKRKGEWNIIGRERVKIDIATLLAVGQN